MAAASVIQVNPSLVSVIVPVYNAARFLPDTLASVRAQTHGDWELLLVDDGSSDGSAPLMREAAAADPRVRVFFHARNRGVAAARNTGLSEARGTLVAFLDSDDLWEPDKLAQQVACLRAGDAALVCTRYVHVDADGHLIRTLPPPPEDIGYRALLKGNVIGCSTVMLDLTRTGPVRFEARGHEDFALWLSLLRRGLKAKGLAAPLVRHRITGRSLSGNKLRAAGWAWKVYRESEGLPLFEALWYFAHYALRSVRKYSS